MYMRMLVDDAKDLEHSKKKLECKVYLQVIGLFVSRCCLEIA